MNLVTCTECGWVHTLVTREEAQRSVDRFNEYYTTLPWARRAEYYGGRDASMEDYMHCAKCGSKEPMRWFENGDCPRGVTIQPTILAPSFHTNPLYFYKSEQSTDD